MSDLRVDTRAIEAKYGLHSPDKQLWNVTPVWQPRTQGKQMVTLDHAGAAAGVIEGLARIFQCKTMAQHRKAVEIVSDQLLWDAPDIRLTNKQHLRMATYIFKRLAQPKLVPIVASVSAPSPGLHLIEVDAVYVVAPHKPWFAPITWLLPDESPCNIHMKIGVKGSLEDGQVELMVARFTNLRPFPPLGWQRGLVGMVLGAVPHALEGLLGFLIDVADGDEHYRKQYRQRFRERHPGSSGYARDLLTDLASDVPQWALEQGTVALESAQAVGKYFFEGISGFIWMCINFYIGLFTRVMGMLQEAAPGAVASSVHKAAGGLTSLATPPLPDTAPASSVAYPPVTPLGIAVADASTRDSAGSPAAGVDAGATGGKASSRQVDAASSSGASSLEVVPVAPEVSASSGVNSLRVAGAVSGGASPRGSKSPASSPRRVGPGGAMRRKPDLSGAAWP